MSDAIEVERLRNELRQCLIETRQAAHIIGRHYSGVGCIYAEAAARIERTLGADPISRDMENG